MIWLIIIISKREKLDLQTKGAIIEFKCWVALSPSPLDWGSGDLY